MIDIQLKSEVLCVQDCIDFVSDDAVGGSVVFIGTVRNHTKNKRVLRLDFEAYEPMA
ncbi:MAG TPA: molybdenum cofactor biosynthesis protein MoaE, partial [Phaeodactylibacter sp.]|nr:molybdenum cofactor biosynthesis protein MoaE [Phaeodactylibacter sp.]